MKCKDCLTRYETGGWFGRWRVLRHCAKCARCGAEIQAWEAFQSNMRSAPPLTAEQRSLWMNSTEVTGATDVLPDITPVSSRISRLTVDWRIVASSAACIAFVVLSVLMLRRPNQDPFPQPGREEVVAQIPETVTSGLRNAKPEFFVSQTQITPVNLADELDQLDVEIIESLNEIDRLKQQLERLAVVQEIDTLLAQHRRW